MVFLRMAPLLAITAIILYAGLRPEPVPQVFDQQDKLHHLLGFAAFAFTLRLAIPRVYPFLGMLLALAFALAVELAQGLQPLRHASPADMLANALGVLLGTGMAWLCQAISRSHTARPSES